MGCPATGRPPCGQATAETAVSWPAGRRRVGGGGGKVEGIECHSFEGSDTDALPTTNLLCSEICLFGDTDYDPNTWGIQESQRLRY
jgi:hypothetical protein